MRGLCLSIMLMGAAVFAAPLSAQQRGFPDISASPAPERPGQGAVLQGLDKVTARISRFEAPAGRDVMFGSLRIQVRDCYKRPPEEQPESAAFLQIDDLGADGRAVSYYSGWMFASSPALSAMEHPVYDVWVVDCIKSSSSASDSEAGKSADTSSAAESN